MIERISEKAYYPNLMGCNLLRSLEEILGDWGMAALLNAAELPEWIQKYPPKNMRPQFAFNHISQLMAKLEELYGLECGRGVALRAGRVFFNHLLSDLGDQIGLNEIEFRLLSLRLKTIGGLQLLAEAFNKHSDQKVQVEVSQQLNWVIERCPFCWQRQSTTASCHFMVGFLQEATYWISGGKHYFIQETACRAAGDAHCTMTIDRQAFE